MPYSPLVTLYGSRTSPGSASIRSSGTITSQGVDQSIPAVVAGDTFVYLGAVSDGDAAHRTIDSAPTLGGVSLTAVPGLVTTSGQNNQVDIYLLSNATGGFGVTFHTSYHAGSAGYLGTWFLIQNASSMQPITSGSDTSTSGATPTVTLAGLTTSDLILEILATSGSPSSSSGQSTSFTGSGNGSNFLAAHRSPSAGSNSETWSQSASAYAFASVALRASVSSNPTTSTGQFFAYF
jgi:hypothetical protein